MKKYKYVFYGSFCDNEGKYYEIDIETPNVWDSEEEAKYDTTGYRFINLNNNIYLVAFEREIMNDDLTISLDGETTRYTYEQFIKNGGVIRKLKETSKDKLCLEDDDYDVCNKSFDELFSNTQGKTPYSVYIDSLAYCIREIDVKDN